ncbi:hypothetical protein [Microbacterium sp. A93]|uniref:hypothetical protein n=1 Tax=Microbacterium sp. A93 TaxID=3450716 RepID=UPI003F42161E
MMSPRRTVRPAATHRTPAVTVLAAASLALPLLAGCQAASNEGRLSILDEEPAESVPGYANSMGILEPGTARLLGSVDEIEYYVGEEAGTRGIVCLVPINTEDPEAGWGAACSTESSDVIVTHEDVNGEAALVADDADTDTLAEDGWTEVSRNLWTR